MRKKIISAVSGTATFNTLHWPEKISVSPALPMRYHKGPVWILSAEPITHPSAPFSVPFNVRAPGLLLGRPDGVFDKKEQLFTQVLFHDPESTLARTESNDLVQLDEIVSQPGLCSGLTSGSAQDRETIVVFSSAPKSGKQTTHNSEFPCSPLRLTD